MTTTYQRFLDYCGSVEKLMLYSGMELEILFSCLLVFSIIWSLGTNLQDVNNKNSVTKQSQFIKSKILKIYISFPLEGDIYDYYIDFKARRFRNWNELIPNFKFESNISYHQIMVPTSDSVKYQVLLEQLIIKGHNTYIMGQSGTGKTNIIQSFLSKLD